MLRKKKVQPNTNDDFFSDEDGGAAVEHEPMPDFEPAPVKKKAPGSRVLLLLLLLVAAGAGGYFYLLPPVEEPASSPPPAPVRRPIPVQPAAPQSAAQNPAAVPAPASQTPDAAAAPAKPAASASAPAAAPAPATAQATAKTAAAPAPVPAIPAATEATTPAVAKGAPPGAKTAAAPAAALAAAAAKAVPAPVVARGAAAPAGKADSAPAAKAAPAPTGRYTVEAGAFLVKANRLAAEKIIGQLGYKAKITTVHRPVKMLRLRVGGPYTPMAAEEKLAELASLAPNAFAVPNGDQMTVYAGSFYVVDEARILADKLYKDGIRVEEETAEVKMPLEIVSFGSFASKEAAAGIVAKAKAAGLQPAVIRK